MNWSRLGRCWECTKEGNPFMPITPPLAAIARISSSGRFREFGCTAAALEWEAMHGAVDTSMASSDDLVPV
jgi:hypothetical protein